MTCDEEKYIEFDDCLVCEADHNKGCPKCPFFTVCSEEYKGVEK